MKRIKKTIVLLACVLSAGIASAQVAGMPYIVPANAPANVCQEQSTRGTDFWVTFGIDQNGTTIMNITSLLLALKISAEQSADVTLTFTATGGTTTYTVGDNSVITIYMDAVQNLGDMRSTLYSTNVNAGVYNNTLHITSSNPVSVYAFNTAYATTDATVLLPVDAWGRDYYRLSYVPAIAAQYDCHLIIANEDNTTIQINSVPTATLNKGQVYRSYFNGDMTGARITSDKPVAYFTHNTGVNIPVGRQNVDILFEQLMSVDRWGKLFLVPNTTEGANTVNNRIRIIASENNTTVNYSGATFFNVTGGAVNFNSGNTLNAGQWAELGISGSTTAACYINADKPVGVATYMVGGNSSGPIDGDPSIAWIPPLNQSISFAIIAPFLLPSNDVTLTNLAASNSIHYMIIVAPTGKKGQTTVNGAVVPAAGWIDNAASGYSYYYWYFDNVADLNKAFKVVNPNGVIVYGAGIGKAESYYYNAGSGACIIN